MIAAFLASAWGRIQGWVIGAGALLAAIATAFLVGRSKGSTAARQEADARDAKANADALQAGLDAAKERNDVEIDTAGRPDGSAAERLRDQWQRD